MEKAVNRTSDWQSARKGPQKARKPWTKPVLRKIKLTDEEIASLRGAADPMALLLKMKPDLKRR